MATASGGSKRLSLGRVVIFALAGLPVGAMAAGLLIYVPPYLATQLGVSLGVVSTVWLVVRLIDIGVDPAVGMLMDRTHSRIGRYRPWMLAGAPAFMLGVAMLFFAPAGITWIYLVGWLLMLYLGMSILGLAHTAWAATLATDYKDRSRIFGIMTAIGILALLVVLSIPVIVGKTSKGDAGAIHAMGWFLVGIAPVAIGIATWLTPERLNADQKRRGGGMHLGDIAMVFRKLDLLRLYLAQMAFTLGPGWMTSIYIFFTRDYMHFTTAQASILLLFYVTAGLLGAPFWAHVSGRIGKHRTVMVIAVAYSLGLMTVLLPPKGVLVWSIPVNLWCGFAGSGFELTVRSMLADVADEVRLEQGRDRLSLIYSLGTATAKISSAVAIAISYAILRQVGYIPTLGHGNSASAVRGLGFTFCIGPIACVMLGAVCMVGWRLTAQRHRDIQTALEARDAERALGIGDGEPVGEAAAVAAGHAA